MNIGGNIRRIREEKGMRQCALAEAVGVTGSMISMIERGTRVPSLPLGADIARVLDVRIDDLMHGKGA